jgi:peptidoglycan/LPS O-acetylase OafA/YrhL
MSEALAPAVRTARRIRLRGHALTFEEYEVLRYFQPLDGLRAVSVLLVLTWHVNSHLWNWLSGYQGVALFFVISGCLITTLCLREQQKYGSVSLTAFYVRRACRIFPLYFLVLGVYVALTVGLNWNGDAGRMVRALPWYLTYMNDLWPHVYDPSAAPFTLSWSLGVEEKFYLLWPLLAFVVWRKAPRLRAAVVFLLVLVPFTGYDWHERYLHYSQIMVGCLLALALAHRPTFERLRHVAMHPWLVLALFVPVHLLVARDAGVAKPLYAPAAALVVLTLILGGGWWVRLLGSRFMVFVGKRAYGIYLIQMLCLGVCIHALKKLAPGVKLNSLDEPIGHGAWAASIALLLVGGLSCILAADALHRTVERPLIGLGRKLTTRLTGHRPVAPARMASESAGDDSESTPHSGLVADTPPQTATG